MEPKVQRGDIIVRIDVPVDPMAVTSKGTGWAILHIERESEYISSFDWYWFGERSSHSYNSENWHLLTTRKEVVEWLHEWELIETRPIGPEDAEYFATDKLMELVKRD
jgi:hypothetical protein